MAGCVIVMSGLVPLQADILRYILTLNYYILFGKYKSRKDLCRDELERLRDVVIRSEIGIQAVSFGAEVQIK